MRIYPINEQCREILLHGNPGMTCYEDIQWLIFMARKTTGNIVEIGTNLGHTSRELAAHFPDRQIITIDYVGLKETMSPAQRWEKPGWHEVGKAHWGDTNVEQLLTPSHWVDYSKLDPGFIFIDGSHSFEGVKADTEQVFRTLAAIEPGKQVCIVWHDYLKPGLGVADYIDLTLEPVFGDWLAREGTMVYLDCYTKHLSAIEK